MTLKFEGKQTIVSDVSDIAAKSVSLIAAEYSGLTVGELTELRQTARKEGVVVRVVRNTLAKRALETTEFACIRDKLTGPLVLVFSQEDPGVGARLLKTFSKDHEKLKVTALAMSNQLLPKESLNQLANLPTRLQGISQVMSVMLAPITVLTRTMVAPYTKLVRTVAAIRDQKQSSGLN
ncbi:MAG: 50S ribosomal protein L10 [Gammaproteobacteria bacterium RIFCSPHIGHO2_12_FULL_42_10]|nr:MAG: 50S ribosomal protein L10 [Gammaproteobacteria bacterium RIFCSPHIGHO2_12_FULL_42_10]